MLSGELLESLDAMYLQGFLQFVIMPLFKEPLAWIIAQTVNFIKAAKLSGANCLINILLHIGLLPLPNSYENWWELPVIRTAPFAKHPLQNHLWDKAWRCFKARNGVCARGQREPQKAGSGLDSTPPTLSRSPDWLSPGKICFKPDTHSHTRTHQLVCDIRRLDALRRETRTESFNRTVWSRLRAVPA